MRKCANPNCTDTVHVADFRTGLIHTNGKYICRTKNNGEIVAAK